MIELSLTMFMRSTGGAQNRKTAHFLGKNCKPPRKPHQLIQPQKRIWIDSEAKKNIALFPAHLWVRIFLDVTWPQQENTYIYMKCRKHVLK